MGTTVHARSALCRCVEPARLADLPGLAGCGESPVRARAAIVGPIGSTRRRCTRPYCTHRRAAARVLLGELEPNTNIPIPWPGYT
jgi:hypothetical protein